MLGGHVKFPSLKFFLIPFLYKLARHLTTTSRRRTTKHDTVTTLDLHQMITSSIITLHWHTGTHLLSTLCPTHHLGQE
jgi:hypothetical protein